MLQTFSATGVTGRHGATADLLVKEYGSGLDTVIALHGGPGAAGGIAPLARELGKRWHVLEPFQRSSGGRPLTVAKHIEDLDVLVRARRGHDHPVLVGHSWGAMLALAYAAEHPTVPAALVLIGCGTFSRGARAAFEAQLEARLAPADRVRLARIRHTEASADRRLAAIGRLMTQVHGHDGVVAEEDAAEADALAHEETWADMLRPHRDGGFPAAFSAIRVPVLMIHGEADLHPGVVISEHLRSRIPHLEYRELPGCGSTPWLERQATQAFFDALQPWMKARLTTLREQPAEWDDSALLCTAPS